MLVQGRAFLFLQGVCSPFFDRLAKRLRAAGHLVVKVNFTGGDRLYWRGPAYEYRGRLDELPSFIAAIWQRHGITDQIVFGDCRPVHREMVEEARRLGIRNHVFEEGYFRPFWVTLEREGVNAHSLLPRDPDWYREIGPHLPQAPKPKRFPNPFRARAFHDVAYHLGNVINPVAYPHYRTHAPVSAPLEYASYALRFSRLKWLKHRDAKRIDAVLQSDKPFFLLPLQLSGDAQIQHHSAFTNMREVIARVIASFAQHAPPDALLLIKNHPLDMGLSRYAALIQRLAQEHELGDRVVYLESGNLEAIVRRAAGTVTVNSTVGNVALELGCPTLALADPIYHFAGLTHQGSLDGFWKAPSPPDRQLFMNFRRTIIHCLQINGGFYSRPAIEIAVDNAMHVLTAEYSPLEHLLCQTNATPPIAS